MSNVPVLYFAAPLFSDAERHFNAAMVCELEKWFRVYLPQRDGGLMGDLLEQGVTGSAAVELLFESDVEAIAGCDLVFAVLDGIGVDEGVAFELGFAHARGKLCFGLQTDFRRNQHISRNVMISGSLIEIFSRIEEVKAWAPRFCSEFNNDRLAPANPDALTLGQLSRDEGRRAPSA